MIVLQPQLLREGWDGHPLCLSEDSSVLMISIGLVVVQFKAVFCPSLSYSSSYSYHFSLPLPSVDDSFALTKWILRKGKIMKKDLED